jgi:riboflavin transporter FmnP
LIARRGALPFIALMAALSLVLSFPPIAVTLAPDITVHFSQLPIFLAGVLTGPVGGLITGAIGGIYMGLIKIPFIIGGLAILGLATGFFGRRVRPLYASLLAWLVQAPYVVVTDYIWFTIFLGRTSQAAWAFVTPMMMVLTIEAVISSALAEVTVRYLKRTRIFQQIAIA